MNDYHALLQHDQHHISVYNKRAMWVHNFYNLFRGLDVNSKFTSRTRKDVAQNPVTAQQERWTTSYFQAPVYEHLARYPTTAEYGALTPAQQEIFRRRSFVYTATNDFHQRAASIASMLITAASLTFSDHRGREITNLDTPSIRSRAVAMMVRWFSVKNRKGVLAKPTTCHECRASVVKRMRAKSTIVNYCEYDSLVSNRRNEMWGYKCVVCEQSEDSPGLLVDAEGNPCTHSCCGNVGECQNILCEHNRFFVSTQRCSRKANSKAQREAAALGCPCLGKCGKFHPVSVDVIRHDREYCLVAAGVTGYTSHALRGNSEVLSMRAAVESTQINEGDARRRAQHSEATQDKYYEREPHPAWVAFHRGLPEKTRRSLSIEEAQRIGA